MRMNALDKQRNARSSPAPWGHPKKKTEATSISIINNFVLVCLGLNSCGFKCVNTRKGCEFTYKEQELYFLTLMMWDWVLHLPS